jgi:hypothetical protein
VEALAVQSFQLWKRLTCDHLAKDLVVRPSLQPIILPLLHLHNNCLMAQQSPQCHTGVRVGSTNRDYA